MARSRFRVVGVSFWREVVVFAAFFISVTTLIVVSMLFDIVVMSAGLILGVAAMLLFPRLVRLVSASEAELTLDDSSLEMRWIKPPLGRKVDPPVIIRFEEIKSYRFGGIGSRLRLVVRKWSGERVVLPVAGKLGFCSPFKEVFLKRMKRFGGRAYGSAAGKPQELPQKTTAQRLVPRIIVSLAVALLIAVVALIIDAGVVIAGVVAAIVAFPLSLWVARGLKPKTITGDNASVNDIPRLIKKLKRRKSHKPFASLMFIPEDTEDGEGVEVMYSAENGVVGFDWALVCPRNIADKDEIVRFASKAGYMLSEVENETLRSLRYEGEGIADLGKRIICGFYEIDPDEKVDLIAEGFEWGEEE